MRLREHPVTRGLDHPRGWFEWLFGYQFTEWRYWRSEGHWCDHRDRHLHLGLDQRGGVVRGSLPGELVAAGWTDWRMVNEGINKYRWCRRCGRWEWI